MNRAEINKHPSVAPALAAWRKAREERDRIEFDGRYGAAATKAARRAADEAERLYDAVVTALLAAGGGHQRGL